MGSEYWIVIFGRVNSMRKNLFEKKTADCARVTFKDSRVERHAGWHGKGASMSQLMAKQKRKHFRRELYEFMVDSAKVKGQQ